MKKFLMTIALIFAFAVSGFSLNIRSDIDYSGEVNYDGDLKIKGTKVTATAAELNAISITISGDVLIPADTGIAVIQPLAVTEGDIVLTEGEILVGDGGTGVAVVVSGDIVIPKTGVAVIQDLAVEDNDIALTDAYIIVGDTGTGSAVAVSGDISLANDGTVAVTSVGTNAGGAGSLTGILKASAGVVAVAVADTDYVQVSSAYGSATAVNGDIASGQLIVTNAITMKDIAGSTLAAYTLTHVWMSETSAGAASTNNIETLALSTGTEVSEVIANGEYWYVTAVGGTAVATITATATGTNYINVGVGPRITSTEIIFLP